MEEDIEIETQIEIFETLKRNIEYIKSIDKDWFVVFGETLISKIKELEEENKQLEAIKDEAIRRYNFESIPKSLVKEKIEELKQKAISYGTFIDKDESFNIQSKISVLQELLGEE